MHSPRRLFTPLVVSAIALAAATQSSAGHRDSLLHVGVWPGVSHTYRTIQAAVNAARPGDRILVAAGDYHESPAATTGVRVTTPDITIEGVDRNSVIVDGTKPGATRACDASPRFQNFGPITHRSNGVLLNGRNGIVIDHVSGVTVENLTVCNFLGASSMNQFGNEIWFDGGAATGRTGLGAYRVANITATSTYVAESSPQPPPVSLAAYAGVLISNAAGPGSVTHSFASNMADSGFHIAACRDCNATFDHDIAIHNDIGFSGTDAGGRLLVENSLFEHNGAGINLASENNQDAPPPQDGLCPSGMSGPVPAAPSICTVIEHNAVQANDNLDVSPDAAEVFVGAGIDIAGGMHDLVFENRIADQSSYGVVTTVFANTHATAYPNARCQEGRPLPAGGCFFNASGNVVADNTLRHNGAFGNPTNGDLADATMAGKPANCFRDNSDGHGPPTMAPRGLQAAHGCAARRGDSLLGVLGVQLLCAVRAFGDCGGNGSAALPVLASFSRALNARFDASALHNTRASYPAPGRYVAPRPGPQPSLRP
jgi:hypothetical protein